MLLSACSPDLGGKEPSSPPSEETTAEVTKGKTTPAKNKPKPPEQDDPWKEPGHPPAPGKERPELPPTGGI